MNDEVRKSKSVKIKPSILLQARLKAVEEGRWLEEAIEEKLAREQEEKHS